MSSTGWSRPASANFALERGRAGRRTGSAAGRSSRFVSAIPGRAIGRTPSSCKAWRTVARLRPDAGRYRMWRRHPARARAARGARRERRRRGHRRRAGVLSAADDAAAAGRLDVPGSGRRQRLTPLRAIDRVFPTAFSFRAHLQKTLPRHLDDLPRPDPLAGVRRRPRPRWRRCGPLARGPPRPLRRRRRVASCRSITTSARAGRGGPKRPGPLRLVGRPPPTPTTVTTSTIRDQWLSRTCTSAISRRTRSRRGDDARVGRAELAVSGGGKREDGGASRAARRRSSTSSSWRELGFNAAAHLAGHDRHDTLPAWAQGHWRRTPRDPRPHRHDRDAFERAATTIPVERAQTELVRDGRIHTYLRRGAKILNAHAADALETMIHLNDKHALTAAILTLQRHLLVPGPLRSPWGRREIRTVRYMSSETRRASCGSRAIWPATARRRGPGAACGAGTARIVWSASMTTPHRDTSLRQTRASIRRHRRGRVGGPGQGASGHATRAHADWPDRAAAREPLSRGGRRRRPAGAGGGVADVDDRGGSVAPSDARTRWRSLWHLRSTITAGQIRMTAGDRPFAEVSVYFDQQVAGGDIVTWSASIPRPTCACSASSSRASSRARTEP